MAPRATHGTDAIRPPRRPRRRRNHSEPREVAGPDARGTERRTRRTLPARQTLPTGITGGRSSRFPRRKTTVHGARIEHYLEGRRTTDRDSVDAYISLVATWEPLRRAFLGADDARDATHSRSFARLLKPDVGSGRDCRKRTLRVSLEPLKTPTSVSQH